MKPPSAKEIGFAAVEDIKKNKAVWIAILKEVAPAFLALALLIQIIGINSQTGEGTGKFWYVAVMAGLSGLLTLWMYPHILIRWHRFILRDGAIDYAGAWWKPDRLYLKFLLAGFITWLPAIAVGVVAFLLMAAPVLGTLVVVAGVVFAIYATVRLTYLLPPTALGQDIDIKRAWMHGKGVFWRTIFAPLRATWKYLLLYIGYCIVVSLLFSAFFHGSVSGFIHGSGESILAVIFLFLFRSIPDLFFNFLLMLVGVGVITRYYRWAVSNGAPPAESSLPANGGV